MHRILLGGRFRRERWYCQVKDWKAEKSNFTNRKLLIFGLRKDHFRTKIALVLLNLTVPDRELVNPESYICLE